MRNLPDLLDLEGFGDRIGGAVGRVKGDIIQRRVMVTRSGLGVLVGLGLLHGALVDRDVREARQKYAGEVVALCLQHPGVAGKAAELVEQRFEAVSAFMLADDGPAGGVRVEIAPDEACGIFTALDDNGVPQKVFEEDDVPKRNEVIREVGEFALGLLRESDPEAAARLDDLAKKTERGMFETGVGTVVAGAAFLAAVMLTTPRMAGSGHHIPTPDVAGTPH